MEENRYKLTEDNAAAGMVAEPTRECKLNCVKLQ